MISLVFLVSCGPSQAEKRFVAENTCYAIDNGWERDSVLKVNETDSVKMINESREKIGEKPFLGDDAVIKEAFEWGLCPELVLNENYETSLQSLKDAKQERERIAAEKRAEEERIAAEKRAEEERIAAEKERIAAEKQRIADSKPSVKEEFHLNGKLQSRINYQPKSGGGKQHGLSEWYHDNGQLKSKFNYKEGRVDGLAEIYLENGQLMTKINHKDGKKDGPFEGYDKSGTLKSKKCYKNGVITYMSYCEK